MRIHKGCVALVLGASVVATAYAQQTQQVLKLPDQIEWKAPPMVGGASTAVLYGDPTKAGVYVTRTKFPAGLKGLPHTHPDEWRTIVVLSGTIYFGLGDDDASRASLRRYYAFLGDWVGAIVEGAIRSPQAAKDVVRAFGDAGVTELVFDPTVASVDEVDRLADAVL